MAAEVFKRHELKYLIDQSTYQNILPTLLKHMSLDPLGDEEGRYKVNSLYFESQDRKIYFETKNKLPFRQKLRLRIYNPERVEGNHLAFFELKQKLKNIVNKRRTTMPLLEAYRYMRKLQIYDNPFFLDEPKALSTFCASNTQTLKEIDTFAFHYALQPAVVVSYDRQALSGISEADLRLTFDYNLRCRHDDLHLEHGSHGKSFIDPNYVILEVKVTNSVPLWLSRLLSDHQVKQKSVSKFCTSIEKTYGETGSFQLTGVDL